MNTIAQLQAVLWDMDGVIVDTFEGHYRSWKQTFEELGLPFTLEMFRRTFGMNNRLILNTLIGENLDENFIRRQSDHKEELFRSDIKGSAQLLPGVEDWLKWFSAHGIRQAVGSSAPQANVDTLLDELKIRSYFQAEVAGEKMRGKPDPAIFLLAAQKLGVQPQNCLVIEDAIAGVEAARRGGMKCVAVLTTNTAENLKSADLILNDLTHLTSDDLKELFPA